MEHEREHQESQIEEEEQRAGTTHDPGLSEAPAGAPESDDSPVGSPEADDEDDEPAGGGATHTEYNPEASGDSPD